MGRLRSWRLTAPNEIRFEELHNRLCLANENRTFNAIIERFYEYERYKPAIEHLKGFIREIALTHAPPRRPGSAPNSQPPGEEIGRS